jgi:hypothetical protein
VTPETVERFRSFLRLRDFHDSDEPGQTFAALVTIAKWSVAQQKFPNASHDELLTQASGFTHIWMGLLLHLATVDRAFFDLSKRMAARTLVRPDPPAFIYRQMAAMLLFEGDGPKRTKPAAARDAAIVLAVATSVEAGLLPTENRERRNDPTRRSGCGIVAAAIGMEYGTIERAVWNNRHARLVAVGFPASEVSDFLGRTSPTKKVE